MPPNHCASMPSTTQSKYNGFFHLFTDTKPLDIGMVETLIKAQKPQHQQQLSAIMPSTLTALQSAMKKFVDHASVTLQQMFLPRYTSLFAEKTALRAKVRQLYDFLSTFKATAGKTEFQYALELVRDIIVTLSDIGQPIVFGSADALLDYRGGKEGTPFGYREYLAYTKSAGNVMGEGILQPALFVLNCLLSLIYSERRSYRAKKRCDSCCLCSWTKACTIIWLAETTSIFLGSLTHSSRG